jgi:hypothetical protein
MKVIKSRRMRWAENVAHIKIREANNILVRRPKGNSPLEGIGVHGKI